MGDDLRQRTCIGCRNVGDKHSMLRLYRRSDGGVGVDLKGNKPGRGAYVCSRGCLEKALERNLVGRSLRTKFAGEFEEGGKEAIDGFFPSVETRGCKE